MDRGGLDDRGYVVVCGCGYCTSWRTLGQAAADINRHSDDYPSHSPTVQRELASAPDAVARGRPR